MGTAWSEESEWERSEFSQLQSQSYLNLEAQAQRFRNPGVSILKEILRRIKLNEDLVDEHNKILGEFLSSFINKLKEEDKLFKQLFNKLEYTGSFYDELRISMPDEFDINMVLKMPFNDCKLYPEYSDIEVIHQPDAPSFVKYRLKNNDVLMTDNSLGRLFDSDGYLIPEYMRNWLQSIVDKALSTYEPPESLREVTSKKAGPARTMVLIKKDGKRIDIDLVPVISKEFKSGDKMLDLRYQVKELVGNNLKANLVPKPYVGNAIPVQDARRLWRVHFPEPEKMIIHDIGCAKNIIRLLKFLRDKEDRKCFASYYLKTVVMWMILKSGRDQDYWKEDKMDERFLEALQELENAV